MPNGERSLISHRVNVAVRKAQTREAQIMHAVSKNHQIDLSLCNESTYENKTRIISERHPESYAIEFADFITRIYGSTNAGVAVQA